MDNLRKFGRSYGEKSGFCFEIKLRTPLSAAWSQLEAEEKELRATLAKIQERQRPCIFVTDEAKKFVETWSDVGKLFEQATPDERFLILQHYVEVVELKATDEKGRTGEYVLRLFPEVCPNRDRVGRLDEPPKAVPISPEADGKITAAPGRDPDLLTTQSASKNKIPVLAPRPTEPHHDQTRQHRWRERLPRFSRILLGEQTSFPTLPRALLRTPGGDERPQALPVGVPPSGGHPAPSSLGPVLVRH